MRILGAPLEKKDLLLPQIDEKRKEVTYWITDSNYCKQDTLQVLAQYPSLDSLEHPTLQTDTLKLIYRAPKKGVIRKKIEERRNKVAQSQRSTEKPLSASSDQGGEANHDGPKEMVAPGNSVGDDPASSNLLGAPRPLPSHRAIQYPSPLPSRPSI